MSNVNEEVLIKNGKYNVSVELSGNEDGETIQNPTSFEVKDGEMTATVIWKDSDIDTMVVDGVEYAPIKDKGDPTFKIIVPGLDTDIDVHTETVAGTQTVTNDYTMNFKSDYMVKLNGSFLSSELITILLVVALAGIGERILSGFFRGRKNRDNGIIESEATVVDEEDIE